MAEENNFNILNLIMSYILRIRLNKYSLVFLSFNQTWYTNIYYDIIRIS